MTETNVPAAEAAHGVVADESAAYELAFHVLPTVAEGEVPAVFDRIKTHISKAGGEVFDEEAPAHLELAYEVEKYLEGRNRRFGSAYFGWVRFSLTPEALPELTATIEAERELLRTLCVKLSKVEEANPFYFHAAAAADEKVVNVDEPAPTAAPGESDDAESSETDESAPAAKASDEDATAEPASADEADAPANDDSEGEVKTV